MSESASLRRYFDNAATSCPKPDAVFQAMQRYAVDLGASPGRGAYREVVEAGRLMEQCRDRLATLINTTHADHIIFTLNATDALNIAIKGIARTHLRRGEPVHLIATDLDHNSVLRPINALVDDGAERSFVPVDPLTGQVDPGDIRKAITPHTRLIATLHGSNVSGTLQPIEAIGHIAREHGIPFLVDAAQTLGHLPIDVQAMPIDMLAFPGHKGLLGPLGTGGLYIRPELVAMITPLREGGTGSVSEQDTQPAFMPDRYETGSHNAIGIIGLSESIQWILDRGVDLLWQHEHTQTAACLEGIRDLPGLRLLGPQTTEHRCGVFSLVHDALSPAEFAAIMEDQFGILGRPGIHCAPRAHRTFGTETAGGALRLSLGPFLTMDDVQHVVQSLHAMCSSGISA